MAVKSERRLSAGRPRPRRRRKKKKGLTWYKVFVICILLIGGLFLCSRLYQLWQIHEDMQETLRQEQRLSEENKKLKEKKEKYSTPSEIANQAREEFGLADPGEIPYKR